MTALLVCLYLHSVGSLFTIGLTVDPDKNDSSFGDCVFLVILWPIALGVCLNQVVGERLNRIAKEEGGGA